MELLPREIEKEVKEILNNTGKFILIIGLRQVGKTSLLKKLESELKNSYYLTLEDEENLEFFIKRTKEFVEYYIEEGIKFLLVDEIQYDKEFSKRLKLIYDLYRDKIRIIATGSGLFNKKDNLGKLVGRVFLLKMKPLSFKEFVLWKDKLLFKFFEKAQNEILKFLDNKNVNLKNLEIPNEDKLFELFKEYLVYGGMPDVVLQKNYSIKEKLLRQIVDLWLEKDIFSIVEIRKKKEFKDLLIYLALNNGSIINYSNLSRELNLKYETLKDYLSILEDAFIIKFLRPFFTNKAKEIVKDSKIYFIDLGIRNSIVQDFRKFELRENNIKSSLLENFVLNELSSYFENIKYWRRKSNENYEIDFIIEKESELIPIEAKSNKKLEKGFNFFIESYKEKVKKGLKFNLNEEVLFKVNNVNVLSVKYWKF
ncbi:MAG: ATP-binding protein [Nanoarchaeota archaeon]